jgi:nitrogen fixation NifU-like protein
LPVDLMSLTSHKTYGPKGIGALFVRRKPRIRIEAQMHGGGHERGMRSGTLPTHQIVGMGEAYRIAKEEMAVENARIQALHDRMLNGLKDVEQVFINGHLEKRVPHNLNISFNYVEGESLIMGIKGLAVSRIGLHLGQPRAKLCAARPGPQRRAGPQQPAHDHRPLDHRGRHRLCGRDHQAQRGQAARAEPAVGDVPGRHRHLDDPVDGSLKFQNTRLPRLPAPDTKRYNTMAYSEKVVDHYENPRNVGSFAKGDDTVGTGMVGAPACGDVMKLQIKVNPLTGVIEDARFKTYGCGSAIASSSLVTEWVKGKTLDQAAALKNSEIAEELALPPVKIHCSILAEDAIKAAVNDYKQRHAAAGYCACRGNGKLRWLSRSRKPRRGM